MLKDKRLNLILTAKEMRKLEALAVVNAEGNKSLMVRNLIRLAWENPKGLGLRDPIHLEKE